MSRCIFILLTAMSLLVLPAVVIASGAHSHDSHDGQQDQQADGVMIMVGSQVNKGVKGTARISDVSVKLSGPDVKTTHHFMMDFADVETGVPISKGEVVLTITNPDAKIGEPVALLGMDGYFKVDLLLDMKGEYHFRLGTKLDDGKKRKFHFHYVNK